jgi:histidyl-tRNA synthetase
MKNVQTVRGFRDLDEEFCEKLFFVYDQFRKLAEKYNCKEIKTPTVEFTDLFVRSVGVGTDIVDKEMFTFFSSDEDENGIKLCLKPEATASIVRSMINSGNFFGRFFTFCNLFRKERPQKGRYREFFTFSVEFFGRKDVFQDIECLDLCIEFFKLLKIPYKLKINNIGNSEDRQNYQEILKKYFFSKYNQLSATSKERFDNNKIMRILDSKEDAEILFDAPKITDYINEESAINFQKIQDYLVSKKIDFEVDTNIVRGLDYYNDLVFEFIDISNAGRQNALCGGGRYDGLFSVLDSQATSAVGFGIGLDRILDFVELPNKRKTIGLVCDFNVNQSGVIFLRKNYSVEILSGLSNYNEKLISKCKKLQKSSKKMFDFIIIEKLSPSGESFFVVEDLNNNIFLDISCLFDFIL